MPQTDPDLLRKIKEASTLDAQVEAMAEAFPADNVLKMTIGQYLQKLYDVTHGNTDEQ